MILTKYLKSYATLSDVTGFFILIAATGDNTHIIFTFFNGVHSQSSCRLSLTLLLYITTDFATYGLKT